MKVSVSNNGHNAAVDTRPLLQNFKLSLQNFKLSRRNFKLSLRNIKLSLRNFKLSLRNFKLSLQNFKLSLQNFKVSLQNFEVSLQNFKVSPEKVGFCEGNPFVSAVIISGKKAEIESDTVFQPKIVELKKNGAGEKTVSAPEKQRLGIYLNFKLGRINDPAEEKHRTGNGRV
jgi:spore coat protein CotF